MKSHANKTQESIGQSPANGISGKKSGGEPAFLFCDNRPEVAAQRRLQEIADNSQQSQKAAQLQAIADNYLDRQRKPINKNDNRGRFNDQKSGIENTSSCSMDDVNQDFTNFNSDSSVQLQAFGYAQGTKLTPEVQQNAGIMRSEPQPRKTIEQLEFLPTTALSTGIVQRVVIQQGDVAGLPADLDTANLQAAKDLIDTLWDSGKRASIALLYQKIRKADQQENNENNKQLIKFTYDKLQLETGSVPEKEQSGNRESLALKWKYWSQNATNNVVQAGLRMWVTGDPQRGINWNMIGKHLRGNLSDEEYRQIGEMSYLLDDQKNNTALVDTYTGTKKIKKGKQLLEAAKSDIRGALDALPDHDGMSYRQSGVANGSVYGGNINVGDYIRDTTFWSTSALRISGSAGTWGEDGTATAPKVYFIINGSTGKYIAKYSGQEEGQKEVLFKDLVTFQVTKIGNFRNETFFVYVTEINANTLPQGQAIKNPYNGSIYQN